MYYYVVSIFRAIVRQSLPISLLLTITLAACVGPVKPMPTQESQETPPSTAATEAPQPTEPLPAQSAPDKPLPVPPNGTGPQEPLVSTEPDTPVVEANPVLVTASRDVYTVTHATTATKTDTPLINTPFSIQAIPRQIMDDQQAVRLEDVTQNVSGVQRGFGYGEFAQQYHIRGFETNFNTFRNGFRLGQYGMDIANLDRVEVLKGPAAALYGRVDPGGLVNQVLKRPLSYPHYALQQQFGSYDFFRTTGDVGGPLNAAGTVQYRVNGAYVNSDSFRAVSLERGFVAPSLLWRPSPETEVTASIEYQHQHSGWDEGIPVLGNRPVSISRKTNFCDDECRDKQRQVGAYLTWSHRFASGWTVRNGFYLQWADNQIRELFNVELDADNRTLLHTPLAYDQDFRRYSAYLEGTAQFHWLGMTHEVLAGGDFYSQTRNLRFRFDETLTLTQDIFNPVRNVLDFAAFERLGLNNFIPQRELWFGAYAQDHIRVGEQIHLLLGGRFDAADAKSGFSDVSIDAAQLENTHTKKFSPRIGVVYQPWPWLSVYGNYVEGLGSNNRGRSFDGRPFDPQRGRQYEGGIKTTFFENRLNGTLAFYHLTKQNVLTVDLDHPLFQVALGEARSRGIELDLAGRLTERMSLIATYAYMDARITQDNGGNTGHRLVQVPEHSGSVWVKYAVLPQRLDVGAGVYLVGKRQGDNANSFQMPGYGRVDLFAAYHWVVGPSRFTAQVNVYNLLDQQYYKSSNAFDGNPRAGVLPGEPLMIYGSLRWEY